MTNPAKIKKKWNDSLAFRSRSRLFIINQVIFASCKSVFEEVLFEIQKASSFRNARILT